MDELDNVLAELDTLTAELDCGFPSSTTKPKLNGPISKPVPAKQTFNSKHLHKTNPTCMRKSVEMAASTPRMKSSWQQVLEVKLQPAVQL